jgi:hypothetical protein
MNSWGITIGIGTTSIISTRMISSGIQRNLILIPISIDPSLTSIPTSRTFITGTATDSDVTSA